MQTVVIPGSAAERIAPGPADMISNEMIEKTDTLDTNAIDRFADENGVAIALVDSLSHEVSTFNNNSICRDLNPSGEFSPECAKYCGQAFERASNGGASYECHAGLECRAIPVGRQLVAIVGRTFVNAENYRSATERSIAGDWSGYPPGEFFENVLLTASAAALDEIARKVAKQTGEREPSIVPGSPLEDKGAATSIKAAPEQTSTTTTEAAIDKPMNDRRTAQASAWRSVFGSLLKRDHTAAVDSVLKFLAHQYGFSALVWLERHGERFEQIASFGDLRDKRLKLGISVADPRLIAAAKNEIPLELGERSKIDADSSRTLSLYTVAISGEISAAIAVLDPIEDDRIKRQIARICLSLAPQMEILRLRSEVARRESLAGAARRVTDSMRHVDAEDFWLSLTQNAAEMLRAERASLMVFDERRGELEIKAIIGAKNKVGEDDTGQRVARIVFDRGEAAVVADVATSGLAPATERGYRTGSFLSCPISIAGGAIGVMNFTDRVGGVFDSSALRLFLGVAPQIAVAVDRATLKEKAGEFEQLSVTDPLTGLLNRRYIEARLAEEIKRSNRHGFPMSLMLLDVDYFKSYNDEFGHPAGDEALKLVGNVIRETLRGADVAARFGGEEFSILLPQTTAAEAVVIAERIRHNIEHANFPHRPVTSSIGVASCSAELCASADLVSAADKALYEAKREGRNRVVVFEGKRQPGVS